MSVKVYQEGSVFKVTTTKTALKIEISLKDLEFLFNESPNNTFWGEPIRIKRGKRAEFADFVARYITEEADSETGDPPLGEMLEKAFLEAMETGQEFCKYPDDEQEG